MDFRIISLPPFRAASSGADPAMDFSSTGILGKFDVYFSAIRPSPRDDFMPRDFLFYDAERKGFVWWWALCEGMDDGGNAIEEFDGGLYLCYVYRDGDDEEGGKRYREALAYIEASEHFALDERPGRYSMGHIITPRAVIDRQGWAQMETFIPIKLK